MVTFSWGRYKGVASVPLLSGVLFNHTNVIEPLYRTLLFVWLGKPSLPPPCSSLALSAALCRHRIDLLEVIVYLYAFIIVLV